ncbi:hypothetical protein LCGC14_0826360 [marine sediment metagenome]|uniref:Uncharacterized protein n=1 Tax=marine sediment metagenome TaxID=412755 RepID=A0A0F9SPP1_9ZZZZ
MLRTARRLIRGLLRRPYTPKLGREADAMEMWHEAAVKGGMFWTVLVGEWERGRGIGRLSSWCGRRCGNAGCIRLGCSCDADVCSDFRVALVRREFE